MWQALDGDEAAMDVGATALAGAELTNGLECKITCETSKARAFLGLDNPEPLKQN